jgi:hypothetical protein
MFNLTAHDHRTGMAVVNLRVIDRQQERNLIEFKSYLIY